MRRSSSSSYCTPRVCNRVAEKSEEWHLGLEVSMSPIRTQSEGLQHTRIFGVVFYRDTRDRFSFRVAVAP